jgi:hypothetical protein
MVDPNNPELVRPEKYFSLNAGAGIGAIIEVGKNGHFSISMSGGSASFLTKKVKYLHELQNLCKAFDNSIVNVNWKISIDEAVEKNLQMDDNDIPVICQ